MKKIAMTICGIAFTSMMAIAQVGDSTNNRNGSTGINDNGIQDSASNQSTPQPIESTPRTQDPTTSPTTQPLPQQQPQPPVQSQPELQPQAPTQSQPTSNPNSPPQQNQKYEPVQPNQPVQSTTPTTTNPAGTGSGTIRPK